MLAHTKNTSLINVTEYKLDTQSILNSTTHIFETIMDNISTQDQLILARSKLWTSEVEKLLRKWRRQISKREKGHSSLNRTFSRRHYILGLPTTIITAIASIGIFATFRNCGECDNQSQTKCQADPWIRLASGIISVIAMILSSLMTFMNYSSRASEHKEASDEYGSMGRYIDSLVLIPPPLRGDPQSVLQNIRTQYDTNIRRYPNLPSKYDAELNYEIIDREKLHTQPPRPEDLPNESGNKNVIVSMAHLLEEDPQDSEQEISSLHTIESVIAKENDHDTSDEEHEVKLVMDLDAPRIYDPTTAAVAAAQLALQRERQIQDSLSAALAFEMQRLDSHGQIKKTKTSKRTET